MRGIDISHHNADDGFQLSSVIEKLDFVIAKATQGTSFVDPWCDSYIQTTIHNGKPFGFYHYADQNDPIDEANFFIDNCTNYFRDGIPVLDWEGVYDSDGNLIFDQSVSWVNQFVKHVHDKTNVWPWIYANPWRIDQGGVEPNCGRWVAKYPKNLLYPPLSQELPDPPTVDGLVCAWQFASDGHVDGWGENLDVNIFYGSPESWDKYSLGDNKPIGVQIPEPKPDIPEPELSPIGWDKDNNGWRYYENGSYLKDEKKIIDDKLYVFDSDGYMLEGWHEIDGVLCYLT